MKTDREIEAAIERVKLLTRQAENMLGGADMTETRLARIEGKLNGLEAALKIIKLI